MLSPLDLQNKRIVTKKKKYDKIAMDEYLELVFENYKELFNENQELQKKVKTLSDGIQYYRSIETTMQKALLLAEKTSKETKDAAILKAEAIEKDAAAKAEKIMSEAEKEYDKLQDKCLYLVQQFNQYKMQLKQVAAAQLELITSDSFDVYSPELEAIQYAKGSLAAGEDVQHDTKDATSKPHRAKVNEDPSDPAADLAFSDMPVVKPERAAGSTSKTASLDGISPMEETLTANTARTEVPVKEVSVSEDTGATRKIPNIKETNKRKPASKEKDDTFSILTADTIDLSDSIRQVQKQQAAQSMSTLSEPKTPEEDLFADDLIAATAAEPKNVSPQNTGFKTAEPAGVQEALVIEPVAAKTAEPLDAKLTKPNVKTPEILEPVDDKEKEGPTLDSLLQSINVGKKKKKKKGQEEDPFEFLGSVDDF